MRNTIILCLLLAACAKEDFVEEVYVTTQTQISEPVSTPITIPEKDYESSLISINHSKETPVALAVSPVVVELVGMFMTTCCHVFALLIV